MIVEEFTKLYWMKLVITTNQGGTYSCLYGGKTTAVSLVFAMLLIVMSGCVRPASNAAQTPVPAPPEGPNPVATIEMQDGQKIVIELYPEIAPNTVYNFISLANKGFTTV